MVDQAEEYAWTSHHYNALGDPDPLISLHESYLALGQNQEQRRSNYRGLFNEVLSAEDCDAISKATHFSMPLGSAKFIEQVERQIGRRIGYAHRGRPYDTLVKNKSLRPL